MTHANMSAAKKETKHTTEQEVPNHRTLIPVAKKQFRNKNLRHIYSRDEQVSQLGKSEIAGDRLCQLSTNEIAVLTRATLTTC